MNVTMFGEIVHERHHVRRGSFMSVTTFGEDRT